MNHELMQVMAWFQTKHGPQGTLGIGVDEQYLKSLVGKIARQRVSRGGLSNTTALIRQH